ncbi:hypothetical protein HBO32_09785 [Pseudomonas nitroreducens]|uniref:hypothetical protein n=1 Tax=Pseudomonas nitroreducens TaxID=46680 RepID=UPI00147427C2|nr:hypothetical protein [Pseudomonas nitroreducens]NMZ73388.1 hypothetical protein [Pseudomonas nitroreducens]
MAVLLGSISRSAQNAGANPHLAVDLQRFSGIAGWPPAAAKVSGAPSTVVVNAWPVRTTPRLLAGRRSTAYSDDFYYRVHVSPQRLELGNVVSTQQQPMFVWNAFLEVRTLQGITGTDEGLQLSGQAAPPLLFAALQERAWQLSVTPDGQPVLDTRVAWIFDNGSAPAIRVTANRIIAWSFAPDWGDSIIERLSALTSNLQSDSGVEQRRALRLAPRREFETQMYTEGRERQLLDMALFGWGGRIWALPIWPDMQLLAQPVNAGAYRITCSTEYLDFVVGGLAMLRGDSAFDYEVVQVKGIDATGLDLVRATQRAWPRGSRFYPVRTAQLMEQPSLTRLTDKAQGAQVHFLVMEPCDWPALAPAATYLGWPVLEQRPDESVDLTSSAERLLSQLDSSMGTPLTTDLAGRAFAITGYRWMDMGRAVRAGWRSLVYALRGQQVAMWIPTHADDLTLVGTVSDVATTLDIENIGYTRFAQSRPGRRDIRIELYDGTILYRRITGSTELSSDIERLSISGSLGRVVTPAQVARICWMVLSRSARDVFEIEHITDSEGLASGSLTFRGVRDDEF